MNCADCKALLLERCRDELAAGARHEVDDHLQQCDACAEIFAQWQQMHALLDRVEMPSQDVVARFEHRLATEVQHMRKTGSDAPKRVPGLLHALWPARPAWAFAYSLLLLSCGLVSGQLLPPDSLGIGPDSSIASRNNAGENATISPEQLVQMCSVQNPQLLDVL